MTEEKTPTQEYLDTLLLYFEEENTGEDYFLGLAERFPDQGQLEKMTYLAKVERCAAEHVRPLLHKFGLKPRLDTELFDWAQEDITCLKRLTAREVAAIEFATLEQARGKNSLTPLKVCIASE